MTRALLWRELILIARTPAVWIAMATQVVVLTLLFLIWGDGVPVMSGTFIEQFASVHAAVLVAVLPWIAARVPASDGHDLTRLTCLSPCAPGRIMLVKGVALMLALMIVVGTAMPHVVLAWRTAAPGEAAPPTLATAWLLCVLVGATSTALMAWGVGRITRWLVLTASAGVSLAMASPAILTALMAGAVVMMAVAAASADRRLRYPAASLSVEWL